MLSEARISWCANKKRGSNMNIQELEEREYTAQSPYEFEKEAVQQEGYLNRSQRYLLTNFDTWELNPFWDGVDPSHPEDYAPGGDRYVETIEEWLEWISVDTNGVPIFF
jgi:hypothetical protein